MEFYVARCKGWDNVLLHSWDTPVAICIFTTKPMLLQSLSALDLLIWSLLCQLRQISTVMLCSRSSAPSRRENGFLFLEGTVGVLTVWWHMNSWHSWYHLHPQVSTQGPLRKIHLDPGEEGSTGSMTEQPPPCSSLGTASVCALDVIPSLQPTNVSAILVLHQFLLLKQLMMVQSDHAGKTAQRCTEASLFISR